MGRALHLSKGRDRPEVAEVRLGGEVTATGSAEPQRSEVTEATDATTETGASEDTADLQDLAGGFGELAGSARPTLVRAAHSVTGRHEDAEDAVQSSLLKAMRAWQRVANQERWRQQAYVRQIVVNTCRSGWRKWGSRVVIGEMPELSTARRPTPSTTGSCCVRRWPAAGSPARGLVTAVLRRPHRSGDSQEARLRPRDGEELGRPSAASATRHAARVRRCPLGTADGAPISPSARC